jgi:hypothetical protein
MFIYKGADTDSPTTGPKARRSASRRWHAVAIVPTAASCAAAQTCKGTRYLACEAPPLPLAECDARRCGCRYAHFDDRRRGPRRADEKTGALPKPVAVDQRGHRGRRSTDHDVD